MRIIAGTHRSRTVLAVEGNTTRPTTDKVKEAIFSRIGSYFEGGEMLDLFAGSGNMSFEAISRGIQHATLCDVQYKAVSTIKKNAQRLDIEKCCTIWKMDYKKALQIAFQEGNCFDFIYLDPPYKQQQIVEILQYLNTHNMVQVAGDVVCESLKEDTFPNQIGALSKVKDVVYGTIRITYYKRGSI